MWSARSGVTQSAMPGGGPPRTNDIDLDERRKTLTGREEGWKKRRGGHTASR